MLVSLSILAPSIPGDETAAKYRGAQLIIAWLFVTMVRMEQLASGLITYGKAVLAASNHLHPIEDYQNRITEIIRRNGLTIVGEPMFHNFTNGAEVVGFTALICLAESHVTLHTWFERGYVDIDVFTCNRKNDHACEQTFDDLAELFGAVRVVKKTDRR
jgi:S-adenosylmethionine decarboxylase